LACRISIIFVGKTVAATTAAFAAAAAATTARSTASAATRTASAAATTGSAIATAAGTAETALSTAGRGTTFALGTGFVHFQIATTKFLTIETSNGFGGFFIIRHFDESETARTAGFTIHRHVDAGNLPERFECGPEIALRSLEIEIAYEQTLHGASPVLFEAFSAGARRLRRFPYTRGPWPKIAESAEGGPQSSTVG
jgi:hypothetical protein